MITKNKNQATKFMGHGCIMFDKQKNNTIQFDSIQNIDKTHNTGLIADVIFNGSIREFHSNGNKGKINEQIKCLQ